MRSLFYTLICTTSFRYMQGWYGNLIWAVEQTRVGPIFCLLLGVSSDYAQPKTGAGYWNNLPCDWPSLIKFPTILGGYQPSPSRSNLAWKSNFTLLLEASFGLRVLSLPASVCLCVRPSVCVCGKHLLVRAITHHPFKLGSPNLDNRCKRPWLRSLLFWGVIDPDLQGQIELQSQNLPHFELVHAITHHQLKLQFPNLEQKCILALFRSLPILGLIEIDLQFNF